MKRTIEEWRLTSRHLNDDVNVIVYLPANYSPLYTYPLAIVQDGLDYLRLGRLISLADRLIAEKSMRRTIFALVPYPSVKERWHRYHPAGDHHDAYIRFIAHELLPELSRRYAIEACASDRTLIGDSLAGAVALAAACRYPHTFGKVIMQSPFVSEAIIDTISRFPHAAQLSIYHSIGIHETAVPTTFGGKADFLSLNRRLKDIMSAKGFAAYHYEENGGQHTWSHWQTDLEKALSLMLK